MIGVCIRGRTASVERTHVAFGLCFLWMRALIYALFLLSAATHYWMTQKFFSL